MLIKISKLVGSKLKILKLFILIFIGAIIELLSIGAILPALFLFADNPGNKTLETFIKFFPSINLGIDEKYFSLILLNFLLVVFTFKFLYLMFLTYYQAVFAISFCSIVNLCNGINNFCLLNCLSLIF